MTEASFRTIAKILVQLQRTVNTDVKSVVKYRQNSLDYLCEHWFELEDMTVASYITWYSQNSIREDRHF